MHAAINALPTAAERTRRAMEVMGRQGGDIVPLFKLSRDEIKSLGDTAESLGAVVDAESVRRGESYKRLEVQVGEAFEGIKRTVAEPILQVLADHLEEIKAAIGGASAFIRKAPDVLFSSVSATRSRRAASVARDLGGVLLAVGDAVLKAVAPLVGPDADLVAGLVRLAADVLGALRCGRRRRCSPSWPRCWRWSTRWSRRWPGRWTRSSPWWPAPTSSPDAAAAATWAGAAQVGDAVLKAVEPLVGGGGNVIQTLARWRPT